MAKRKICINDDPVLRKKCRPVEVITPSIRTLLEDMLETMHDADGVGLAGPQVGILRRVIVVETEEGHPYLLVNPEIVASSGEQEGNEGCLSLPGKSGFVRRPMNVTVKATDIDGNEVTIEASELLARAFCHEIDHLDGRLYSDIALYMNEPEEPEEPEPTHRKYRHKK